MPNIVDHLLSSSNQKPASILTSIFQLIWVMVILGLY